MIADILAKGCYYSQHPRLRRAVTRDRHGGVSSWPHRIRRCLVRLLDCEHQGLRTLGAELRHLERRDPITLFIPDDDSGLDDGFIDPPGNSMSATNQLIVEPMTTNGVAYVLVTAGGTPEDRSRWSSPSPPWPGGASPSTPPATARTNPMPPSPASSPVRRSRRSALPGPAMRSRPTTPAPGRPAARWASHSCSPTRRCGPSGSGAARSETPGRSSARRSIACYCAGLGQSSSSIRSKCWPPRGRSSTDAASGSRT